MAAEIVDLTKVKCPLTLLRVVETLFKKTVSIGDLNMLQPDPLRKGYRAFAKVRSTMQPATCIIGQQDADSVEIIFEGPLLSPAPG